MEDYILESHKELEEIAVSELEANSQTEFDHLETSYYRTIIEDWKLHEKYVDQTLYCKFPFLAMRPILVEQLVPHRKHSQRFLAGTVWDKPYIRSDGAAILLIVDSHTNTTRVVIKNAFHYTAAALEALRAGLLKGDMNSDVIIGVKLTVFEPCYEVFNDPNAMETSYAIMVDDPNKVMIYDDASTEGLKALGNINYNAKLYDEAQRYYDQAITCAVDVKSLTPVIADLCLLLKKIDRASLSSVYAMFLVAVSAAFQHERQVKVFYQMACTCLQEELLLDRSYLDGLRAIEEGYGLKCFDRDAAGYVNLFKLLSLPAAAVGEGHIAYRRLILQRLAQGYASYLQAIDQMDELTTKYNWQSVYGRLKGFDMIVATLLLNKAATLINTDDPFEAALCAMASTMIPAALAMSGRPSLSKALYRVVKAFASCCVFDEAMTISQQARAIFPAETSFLDQQQELLAAKIVYETNSKKASAKENASDNTREPEKRKKLKKVSR